MSDQALLGAQQLAQRVPGNVLQNLNEFAIQAGDIPPKAFDQLTNPALAGSPFSAPTLASPAMMRLLTEILLGTVRGGVGTQTPPEHMDLGALMEPRK